MSLNRSLASRTRSTNVSAAFSKYSLADAAGTASKEASASDLAHRKASILFSFTNRFVRGVVRSNVDIAFRRRQEFPNSGAARNSCAG
jgi:hypothetical protein